MDVLLRYYPTRTITFSITLRQKTTTTLSLTNISELPVAYKVKTTNVKRYCVCPNAAVVQPGKTISVELSQAFSLTVPPDLDACTDRFLLQAIKLDDSLSDVFDGKDLQNLFKNAPASKIFKVRFNVHLELAGGQTDVTVLTTNALLKNDQTQVKSPPGLKTDTAPSLTKRPLAPPLPPKTSTTSPKLSSAAASATPRAGISTSSASPSSAAASRSPVASSATATTLTTSKPAPSEATSLKESKPDYKSVAWARERVLGVRPAPKVIPPSLDRAARQRVAVERAGELVRVINSQLGDIDKLKTELAEARHKLSDAEMATRPAYDVRYEVVESAKVPFAQICIMAVISGALLQLLV